MSGILGTLQHASESLDLTKRVSIFGRDEFGQTAVAFNNLMTRINDVMLVVRDSVASVSPASRQIAAGNIDLSSRTEEQAASL